MSIVPTSSPHMRERRFDTANDNFAPIAWWFTEGWRCGAYAPEERAEYIPPEDCHWERMSFDQGFWHGQQAKLIKGAAA